MTTEPLRCRYCDRPVRAFGEKCCGWAGLKHPQGPLSATGLIALAIARRTPRWVVDQLYSFLWVFGDPQALAPGRQIICDGTTNRPVIIANARGCRITIEIPHVSGGDDIGMVVETLTAFGALDEVEGG